MRKIELKIKPSYVESINRIRTKMGTKAILPNPCYGTFTGKKLGSYYEANVSNGETLFLDDLEIIRLPLNEPEMS